MSEAPRAVGGAHDHVAPGDDQGDARGPAIETIGVTKTFGGVAAVEDLSIRLPSDSTVGILGPNGAGKTTLLNLVAGMMPVTAGRIRIYGTDVTSWPSHRVARLGVARTFQGSRLVEELSVAANVALGQARATSFGLRSISGLLARERNRQLSAAVDEVLDELELGWAAHRLVRELSYGTRRRVELARVMVSAPTVVLLDEPAAGLNIAERQHIVADIAHLRRGGATVVLIEHDLTLMMRVCDQLVALQQGRLLGVGTPAELQAMPEFVESYLGSAAGAA